jgi:cytochrome c-type biogenesis protein
MFPKAEVDTVISKRSSQRLRTFSHALLFVLGFSLVFVFGWGGTTTLLGQLFSRYKSELGQIGAVVVILFGLFNLGILKLPWLAYDSRPEWKGRGQFGFLPSLLMGVFFAAGWTPCIGTTLGAILTLGFSQETAGQALWLSSGYALGLGIPFLIIALGIDRAAQFLRGFRQHIRRIQIFSGIFLIFIGIMILSRQMVWISIWAQRNNLYIDLPWASSSSPNYLLALIAGLLSFFSPCVLPLVPAYVGYLSGRAAAEL